MLKRKVRRLIRSLTNKVEDFRDRLADSLRPQPRLVPIPVRVKNRR